MKGSMTKLNFADVDEMSPLQCESKFPGAGTAVIEYVRPVTSSCPLKFGLTVPLPSVVTVSGVLVGSGATPVASIVLVVSPPLLENRTSPFDGPSITGEKLTTTG